MAHHMELAARKVLKDHLDDDEEGVGSHLSIDHLAPAPVGSTVRIVAEAVEMSGHTLICDITAYHVRLGGTQRTIGRGRQVQRVLPKATLAALINRAEQ